MKVIKAPVSDEDILSLKAGEEVLVEGIVYAARDAAHKRMVEALQRREPLPFAIEGQIIYYVGPCPAPPGKVIGSAGPTTSGRMDSYTPPLLSRGLKVMIGKGERSPEVVEAMKRYKAVYLATIGGAGVYLAHKVKEVETIAYEDLGPEALRKFRVENFPCIVAIDAAGNNIYNR
ncbi:fumarate hydratase subunit beta [Thermosyntropha lipolytica DSM 11003]|uniref:Fumarate hydratase subunit beta n=1 Tax=Thermosyntropha lipolytica DSM 11003 TaxID=1123382 RepID=A0A1M5MSN2_9FIRM|nr:Fe-S-containing hydro-lyase [Thermosyntropha lipolytica]SHG80374.1 fumarate hydratase subunit beta [Thermosyntropha lipolytica DSM 11003]